MTIYDDIILRHGPQLYLPFDDTSGTTATALAGSDGTYNGSVTLSATGPDPVGSTAVYVDADSEYISTGLTTQWSPFSCEIWFKWDGHTLGHDNYMLIDKRSYFATSISDFPFTLHVTSSGVVRAQFSTGDDFSFDLTLDSTTNVDDSAWHHAAVTYVASGTTRLYVDAVEEASGTVGSLSSGSRSWAFGRVSVENGGGANASNFAGSLAAAALYNYELTATQVAQHYNAAPPAFRGFAESQAEADAAALHVPLDDIGGTTAYAGVGSNGTYSGNPTLRVTGPSDVIPYGISTDGTDDVMVTPSVTLGTTQPQTWEWWSNASAEHNSTTGAFVLFAVSATGGIGTGPTTGLLTNEVMTVYRTPSVDERTGWSGSVISAGWHHHVLAYDGTQNGWTWYLDGTDAIDQGFSKISNAGGSSGFATDTFRLGSNAGGSSFFAWAGLAAFTIYDSELTAAEVYERYTLGLSLRNAHARGPVIY